MSVKAMGLVWDLECPKTYGEIIFRPSHKFTLLAYADHADHHGKNIYPAIGTIAKKTGLDERTVQRITSELVTIGFMVSDGHGPRGTNKWSLAYSDGGWRGVTPGVVPGDKTEKSLGDIPSGDIPSGGVVSPDLKELNLTNIYISTEIEDLWNRATKELRQSMKRAEFDTWLRDAELMGAVDRTLVISVRNAYTIEWLKHRVQTKAQELTGFYVVFVVKAKELEEA